MRYTPILLAAFFLLSWAAWRHHAALYHRHHNRHGRTSRTRSVVRWIRSLRIVHVAVSDGPFAPRTAS